MKSYLEIIEELQRNLDIKLGFLSSKNESNIPENSYYKLNNKNQISLLAIQGDNPINLNEVIQIIGENISSIKVLNLFNFIIKKNDLNKFTRVRTLTLNNCKIDTIPSINNKYLKKLFIDNAILNSQSIINISEIISLKELYLINSKLINIEIFKNLINLVNLNISENLVKDISFLIELKKLTSFWAYNNEIDNISVLENLTNLTELGLGKNKITNFNPIKKLNLLKNLQLLENNINEIEFLSGLTNLNHLQLSNNLISDIEPLRNLKSLISIYLGFNKIAKLPSWIVGHHLDFNINYRRGNGFSLIENPLVDPPVEIINQGKKAIKAWFSEERSLINEVKVLLVGNGEVGKTTLVKCLTGVKPDPNENSTHHINISSHSINYKGNNLKLNFWDFGGQEVMHSTHQFFLSKRSIYLLLLDGRRDEDAEYWLKHIESFGGNSPVLVIMNKIDTNPSYEVDRRFLKNKFPFIIGFYKTACFGNKRGIDEVMSGIIESLENVQISQSPWPKSWFKIKEEIEGLSENFISQEKYERLCNKHLVKNDITKEILASFLNDLGVVVHFKDLRLNDLHILQPRWASRAAYKIINSKSISENHGVFEINDMFKIMIKSDELDFEYKSNTFPFILELMNKFELCYQLNNSEYLVPELLDVQQPDIPIFTGPVLKFTFKYEDILPRSIITRFIVRMHEDIYEDLRWRTGVILHIPIFDSYAIIIADLKERTVNVTVYGKDRIQHFAIIRKTINDLNNDFEKLLVSEWIPLPDENGKVEYKELLGYEEAGKNEYFVGKIKKNFNVKELLNGVIPENIRTRSFVWDVFLCHSSLDKALVMEIAKDLESRGVTYWLDEEQIQPGDSIIEKITDGLSRSNYVTPLFSKNQLDSGWARKEYNSILSRIISGKTKQKLVPLILDNITEDDMPLFFQDIRSEKYLVPKSYSRFLKFLEPTPF